MKNTSITKNALSALILMSSLNLQASEEVKSSEWTGNVSGYIGSKSLKESDWNSVDKQVSLGVIFDFKKESWPVSLVFDTIVSADVYEVDSQKDTGATREFDLGVRKIFDINGSSFKPYIGGGVAFISAELEQKDEFNIIKENQSATGSWVGAGTYYEINSHFIVGLDVRYSKADTNIFDVKREIGGLNAGFTVGYHW